MNEKRDSKDIFLKWRDAIAFSKKVSCYRDCFIAKSLKKMLYSILIF